MKPAAAAARAPAVARGGARPAGRARRRRQGHRGRAEPRAHAQLPARGARGPGRPQPARRARGDRGRRRRPCAWARSCTQRDLERHAAALAACPLLELALPYVGHVATRNRGTVGGSIAHADAAAELPLLLQALGGEVEVTGPAGVRLVPAEEFFVSHLTSCLEPERDRDRGALPGHRRGLGVGVRRGRAAPRRLRRVMPWPARCASRTGSSRRPGSAPAPSRTARCACDAAERALVGSRWRAGRARGRRRRGARGRRPERRHARLGRVPAAARGRARRAQRAGAPTRRRWQRERARADGQRPRRRTSRSTPPAALRLPAPLARPARDARRLRARRLRRVHGATRRARRPLCLMLAVQAEGCTCRDGRGAGRPGRPALGAPGSVPASSRAAVRVLHAGILMSAAELLARRREADAAGDRGAAVRPPLPLHRLRADRRRHRRGRGERGE